jgi:hypothetical protein
MKRRILIPAVVLFMLSWPGPSRAETHVYVSFSVGGAVVIGAGVLFWGISYSSRVSENEAPGGPSNRLSLATEKSAPKPTRSVRLITELIPQPAATEARTRFELGPVSRGPAESAFVGMPLLVFRW